MREQFRGRLNRIPGVDLPASKIELRPAFPLSVLADSATLELLIQALDWFHQQATRQEPAPRTDGIT
jgi:hypothetical protein